MMKTYGKEDHGGGAKCTRIFHDHRGITYIGNEQGVLEFDGIDWELHPHRNQSTTYCLCQDEYPDQSTEIRPRNRLFTGGSGDLGYLAPNESGKLTYTSLLNLIPENARNFTKVRRCHSTKEGVVFQTEKYLFRYDGKAIEVISPTEETFGFYLTHSLFGDLYVDQYTLGIGMLKGKEVRQVEGDSLLSKVAVKDMHELPDGNGLVLTQNHGMFLLKGDRFEVWDIPANDFLKGKKCILMDRSPNGTIAIRTSLHGIIVLDPQGEVLAVYNEANGRSRNGIFDLKFDRLGNLWVAHRLGVDVLELSSPFTHYDEDAGVQGTVMSVEHYQGKIFVCTPSGLFSRTWEDGPVQYSDAWGFQFVGKSKTTSINLNQAAGQLFYTSLGRLHRVPESGEIDGIIDGGAGNINTIVEPSQYPGHLIGLGSKGLFLLKDSLGSRNKSTYGLHSKYDEIHGHGQTIVEMPLGVFWANHPAGGGWRFQLDPDNFQVTGSTLYGEDSGLPVSAMDKVRTLGNAAVFLTKEGVYRYKEQEDRFYADSVLNPALNGFHSIAHLSEDKHHQVWILSSKPGRQGKDGPSRLHVLKPKKERTGDTSCESKHQVFLRITDLLSDRLDIAHLDNGDALLTSTRGLLHYNSASDFDPATSFDALIRKVELIKPSDSMIFGGAFPNANGVPDTLTNLSHRGNIPYSNNSLRFTCSSNYKTETQKFKFRFFLKGYDQDWSAWTSDNKKEYSNLREGTYTFRIQVLNIFETESRIASFTFTISPPWYRTLWAYGLYVLLGIGGIWGIVRLNTRRLQKDKERLEATVASRTEELRKTNEKLVEMDKFKQGMTSMIVHDLKNPLNAIIHAPPTPPGGQNNFIRNIGQQMLNMVLNILDVHKYEETQMTVDARELDLNSVVRTAVEEVVFLVRQKSIDVSWDVGAVSTIIADPAILSRVFINLLTNAIKFTPMGGSIEVTAEKVDEKTARISVKDTGEGIPADKLKSVFQKFGQVIARRSGSVRSTGIGLTFCKLAIEAHGGQIGVESEVGTGTTFWFTLEQGTPGEGTASSPQKIERPKEEINLSAADREALKATAEQLIKIPIYKISQIKKALKEPMERSGEQGKWSQSMHAAARAMDQERLTALLSMILQDQSFD